MAYAPNELHISGKASIPVYSARDYQTIAFIDLNSYLGQWVIRPNVPMAVCPPGPFTTFFEARDACFELEIYSTPPIDQGLEGVE